jgi:mono/diheme cytochrome c family protein
MKPVSVILLVVLVTITACRSVRRGEPVGRPAQVTSAESKRGQVIYQQRCDRCHPNGEGGLGPSLNDKPAPVFLMKTQVRAGLGAMPHFDSQTLTPDELRDLMAYVMDLRKAPRHAR